MAWADNPYQVFTCSDYANYPEGCPIPTRSPDEYATGVNNDGEKTIKLTKTQINDLYASGELWIQTSERAFRLVPTKCFRAAFKFKTACGWKNNYMGQFERIGETPEPNYDMGWRMSGTEFDELLKSGDFAPVIDGFWTMYNKGGQLGIRLLAPYDPSSPYNNQLHPIIL